VSGDITVLAGGQAIGTTVSSGGFLQLGQAPFSGQPGSAGGTATARSCRVVSRL
jgi:autotransporter passenger strand-loop-strand repeat protein